MAWNTGLVSRLLSASLIVSTIADAQGLPVVRPSEVRRVGGLDAPDYAAFSQEPSLVADRQGVVYARIPNEALVRVFDGNGTYQRSIGRRGEGPGEFVVAAGHGLVGDTLWIRNWPLPRMSLFAPGGQHIRTWRTQVDIGRPFPTPEGITALLIGDRAAMVPDAVPLGAGSRASLPVIVGDRDLGTGDTVAFVLRPQGMLLPRVGSFRMAPFPLSPLVSVAGDGSGLLVASWSEDAPDRLDVRRVSRTGSTIWQRSLTMAVSPTPRRVRDSLLAVATGLARSPVEAAKRQGHLPTTASVGELVRQGLHIPSHLPPIRRVVEGLDGTIWLERFSLADARRWLVLDSAGQPSFEAELPPGMTLHQTGDGAIWATQMSDDGVPFIVWLSFSR